MKNIVNGFLVVAFLIFSSPVIAQENNDTENLLGDKLPQLTDLGFYVAPAYQFTQLDDAAASLFHIRGGISYKKQLNIGGFYNVSLNQINPQARFYQMCTRIIGILEDMLNIQFYQKN